MERTEVIVNEDLKVLLADLKEVDGNIVKMVDESEKAKQEFDKEIMIRQKLVDKMKPVVEELFNDKLDEFEVLADLSLTEDGEIKVKIANELEMWKDAKRNQKKVKVSEPQVVDESEKVDEILAEIA